ncbi:membrane protein [Staphylococcus phage CF5]|uniref:Membrane protein n=1 Tax=Staphylococcus phage CF5 TaxID=3113739 RepID=A0AAX4J7K6_9CAUD|nr:membrane protein [Staphylococcus phage CF5]
MIIKILATILLIALIILLLYLVIKHIIELIKDIKGVFSNMKLIYRFNRLGYDVVSVKSVQDNKVITTRHPHIPLIEERYYKYHYTIYNPNKIEVKSSPVLSRLELENLIDRLTLFMNDISKYCTIKSIDVGTNNCTLYADKYRIELYDSSTVHLIYANTFPLVTSWSRYNGNFKDNINQLEKQVDFFYEDMYERIYKIKTINGYNLSYIENSIIATKKFEHFNIEYMFTIQVDNSKMLVYRDNVLLKTLSIYSLNDIEDTLKKVLSKEIIIDYI